MSFYIDSTKNNGYPYIQDIPEMPSSDMQKPYHRYFFILDKSRNNGYPAFRTFEDMPVTDMQKLYPHGFMLCMGESVNDGYPCIPEISNIHAEKFSLLYFGEKHIDDLYYRRKYISAAYCNGKRVFSVKYVKI